MKGPPEPRLWFGGEYFDLGDSELLKRAAGVRLWGTPVPPEGAGPYVRNEAEWLAGQALRHAAAGRGPVGPFEALERLRARGELSGDVEGPDALLLALVEQARAVLGGEP